MRVEDPNIGCGHQIKLINEWVLRRGLYKHSPSGMNLIEVRKVCGSSNEQEGSSEEMIVPSKEEETFVVMCIGSYKVSGFNG